MTWYDTAGFVKSGLRLYACWFLYKGNLPAAAVSLALAEVLGIMEKIDVSTALRKTAFFFSGRCTTCGCRLKQDEHEPGIRYCSNIFCPKHRRGV